MISKWGKLPLYKHYLYKDPYDESPSDVTYYRYFQVIVPNDISEISIALGWGQPGQIIYLTSSQFLASNSEVRSGIEFRLVNNSELSLGSYWLRNQGAIIIETGSSLEGVYVEIVENSVVQGYYPSFSSAIENVVTNQILNCVNSNTIMSSNYSVPDGVTVNIKNGANLYLNGKYLNASNGSIVVESGGDILGYSAIVKQGSTYKGYYSSLADALSNATPGQTVELTGRYDLVENVTVPDNVTLVLGSNSILDLNGYYLVRTDQASIVDNGVVVEGLKTVTHDDQWHLFGYFANAATAFSVSGSNKMHVIQSGSHIGNLELNSLSSVYVTGTGASTIIYGHIDVNNSTNVSINSLRMGSSYNIYFSGGSGNSIGSLHFNGTANLAFFNNTSNFYGSYLTCTTGSGIFTGIMITNSSGTLSNSSLENCYNAVGVYQNAYSNVNYNYFCTNTKDIVAYAGAYVTASSNTYSGDPSQTTGAYGGYISISGTTNQCGGSLAKGSLPQTYPGSYSSEFSTFADSYNKLLQSISYEDRKNKNYDAEKLKGKYKRLIRDIEKFVEKYESIEEAKLALGILAQGYRIVNDNNGLADFLSKLSKNKKYTALKSHVKRYEAEANKTKGLYDDALANLDEAISTTGLDDNFVCEVLFEKSNIAKYHLDDVNTANQLLNTIIRDYPDSYMSILAAREFKNAGVEIPKLAVAEVAQPEEFDLSTHPNPFNPSTTISYSIPEKGHVVLKIYDILGKEVSQLVNEVKEAGIYEAQFDGSKLASGMYIVNMRMQGEEGDVFNQSRKILLMK